MVYSNNYSKILIKTFPKFKGSRTWQEHIKFWEKDDAFDIYKVVNSFKQYFIDEVLKENLHNEVDIILNFVENEISMYQNFDEDSVEKDYENALCTIFLESLLNHASNHNIEYHSFIPKLGKNSRLYCKYWDKFTGVRSPGLWTDSEWEQSQLESE